MNSKTSTFEVDMNKQLKSDISRLECNIVMDINKDDFFDYSFLHPRKSFNPSKWNDICFLAMQSLYNKGDYLMYYGMSHKVTFKSVGNTAKHQSFKSSSTNPVDVGLLATATNASELEALINSAINYLELHQEKVEDEDKDKVKVKITCITGITEFEDVFKSFSKIKYIFSEFAGNNIIIFNTNAVQINLTEMGSVSVNDDKSDDENICYSVRTGVPNVLISDPKQSLFYIDVLK